MARAAERRSLSLAALSREEITIEELEPKVWPQTRATYVLDPQTGKLFNWPWPTKHWNYNSHAIDCILIVAYMEKLVHKNKGQWTPQDDKFYMAVHEEAE